MMIHSFGDTVRFNDLSVQTQKNKKKNCLAFPLLAAAYADGEDIIETCIKRHVGRYRVYL